MEDILQYTGAIPGPTSIILVGVHGNERCGIEAMDRLLDSLQIEKGTVYIGYGNPRAIEQNVRFTETNLNRMFKPDELLTEEERKSYEYQRAQYLKSFLDRSEVLLDIHASSNPQSRRFAICEENAHTTARYLPIPLLVSGFDAVEPGGTDYYMNTTGKIGICVECGYLGDPASTDVAQKSILSFLKARGHISGETQAHDQTHVHMNELYITKTDAFTLPKPFADFEELKKGDTIGYDGTEELIAKEDSIILFARERNKVGEEGYLMGVYVELTRD